MILKDYIILELFMMMNMLYKYHDLLRKSALFEPNNFICFPTKGYVFSRTIGLLPKEK